MNKIAKEKLLIKAASMDISPALYLLGAAMAVSTFGVGFAAGAGTAKMSEPGAYDKDNLHKQYMLKRKRRDNKVQQVQEQREAIQRQMRNKTNKPMRVF